MKNGFLYSDIFQLSMEVYPEYSEEDLRRFRDWETGKGEEYLCDFVSDVSINDRKLKTDLKVPGRILGRHEVYSRVGASQYIVDTVRDGYKLVFDTLPLPSFTNNNKSAILNRVFMWEELIRLEALGCISRVQKQPKVVLPLSVVYSKKPRLVVDASRGLNPYCTKRGIVLEDLGHIQHTVKQGDFMMVNDLDSGYWHVPIAQEHKTYLGVHFEHEDCSKTFWVWNVLCLGLRDAAHIFTKVLNPLMGDLRKRGMRGLLYIDDKLTVGVDGQNCLFWFNQVRDLLEEAGWVFKPSKSSGFPS